MQNQIVWLSYILAGLTYFVFLLPAGQITEATLEDGPFENIGAVSCFLGSIIFFIRYFRDNTGNDFGWLKTRRNIFFLLIAVALFFIAGEEISWGQRILGLQTPETWSRMNVQHEMTVHNLKSFHSGKFQLFNLLLNAAVVVWCGLIPLAVGLLNPCARFIKKWNLPLLPISLCSLALFVVVSLKYIQWHLGSDFDRSVGEIKESDLEFLFMMFAFWFLAEVEARTGKQ